MMSQLCRGFRETFMFSCEVFTINSDKDWHHNNDRLKFLLNRLLSVTVCDKHSFHMYNFVVIFLYLLSGFPNNNNIGANFEYAFGAPSKYKLSSLG